MRALRLPALCLAPVLLLGADPAAAQRPYDLSLEAGAAVPVRSEADIYDLGVHVGVGVEPALLPLRLEGSLDRMGASGAGESLSVWSVALTVPMTVSLPGSPIELFGFGGGGFYNHRAADSATDVGLTGGAGVRLRSWSVAPFLQGRGVLVLSEGNKLTYLAFAAGLRL